MDRAPRVIAALYGHIHRNAITPRPTAGRRLLADRHRVADRLPPAGPGARIDATAGGGVAIRTWMLDHAGPGPLGPISRQLSYLDPAGGRPEGSAGSPADRNVILYRRAIT